MKKSQIRVSRLICILKYEKLTTENILDWPDSWVQRSIWPLLSAGSNNGGLKFKSCPSSCMLVMSSGTEPTSVTISTAGQLSRTSRSLLGTWTCTWLVIGQGTDSWDSTASSLSENSSAWPLSELSEEYDDSLFLCSFVESRLALLPKMALELANRLDLRRFVGERVSTSAKSLLNFSDSIIKSCSRDEWEAREKTTKLVSSS